MIESEMASELQALARLRERQRLGKYAEERANDCRLAAAAFGDGDLRGEWYAGMAHAFRIMADKAIAEMPNGEWLPEGG